MSTASTGHVPILAARSITKSFGGVHALTEVSFDLHAGEVHALIGENGAGKSTLINLLSGALRPDSGELLWAGQPTAWHNPADAQALGVATVFQELDLVPSLIVAENLLLGDEPRRGPFVMRRRLRRLAQESLDEVGSDLNPDSLVGELSLADQQRVAIARAARRRPRVLVLDEPTTPLGPDEVRGLFDLLDTFRQQGMAIVFISHRLGEVLAIADRVSVLRDGQLVGERSRHDATAGELVRMMTGRDIAARPARAHTVSDQVRLRASGIPGRHGLVNDIVVHGGEVVGIAGLAGAGRSRLLRSLIGAPWVGGSVEIDGLIHKRMSPAKALKCGVAYVPEDRKNDGLVLGATLVFNANLGITARSRRPLVSQQAERSAFNLQAQRLSIKGTPNGPVAALSGGNQQKTLLARVIAVRPGVLLLDEPTRGVDIGTKEEIWRLIEELAGAGAAVLVASSELPEILRLSDRILVMREGSVVAELTDDPTEEAILNAALPDVHTAQPA